MEFFRWMGLIASVLACAGDARAQETFGERLGWKPDKVVVVMHCDNAGLTPGTSRGVNNALSKGVGSSYSIMMPCPWVPAFVRSKPTESQDIGLEVTLTSPFDLFRWGPLAGKPTVPGLVDTEGCFWKTTQQLASKATADEVEREIRAQLDRATNMDLKITHFTTFEGGVYAKPEFYERYLKVAMERKIPPVIAGGHMDYLSGGKSPWAPMMKAKAVEVWNAGFPVVDDIIMQVEYWEIGQKRAKLEAVLHSLKPGVTHIVFRPAMATDEVRLIMQNSASRIQDNMILTDLGVRRVIEFKEIVVTDWVELQKRRAKAKAIEP
jgi:hypothetical protein